MASVPPIDVLDRRVSGSARSAPLHAEVEGLLRSAIDTDFEDGDTFWSELSLAQHLGISRGTVRLVLSKLSREGLLIENATKQRLVRKTGGEVGIFVPNRSRSDFGHEMIMALAHACYEMHQRPFRAFFTQDVDSDLDSFFRLGLSPHRIRLLLFDGAVKNAILHAALTDRGYSTVTIDSRTADFQGPYIGTDTVEAMHLGLSHLLNLGHRRVLLLVPHSPSQAPESVKSKVTAFEEYLLARGITSGTVHQLATPGNYDSFQWSYSQMDIIWASSTRPTAIFTVDDPAAYGVLKWLGERSIRVPQMISVLGFEGASPGQFTQPALTTIAHNLKGLARRALEMLWDDSYRQELVPPELIVRDSTGFCP
jgi:DNA-binding LacI/PurR family transcriptional regulator